jgi:hypothetical protein
MALHSRADYAKICGLSPGNLSNYIKRGKVILSGEYVDDKVEQNITFLEKRIATMNQKVPDDSIESIKTAEVETDKPKIEKPRIQTPNITVPDERDDDNQSFNALTKREKKVNIQKKEEEIKLLRLKEEKIRGQVIPIDVIKNLFRAHTQSIVTAQKDGIEDLLINISSEARISGEQLARLRGKMVEILNTAVDKAILSTKKNLSSIVNEFTEKKEVGERT